MKNAISLAAVLTVFAAEAHAEALSPCEPRVSIASGVGVLNGELGVDPVLAAGSRLARASASGSGVEVAAGAAVPFINDLTVRVDVGTARRDIAVERAPSGESIRPQDAGDVRVSRVIVGLQRTHPGRFTCFYATVGVGLYRFSYRGVSTTGPGGIAALGIEAPARGSHAFFFELGLDLALPQARPPVTPTGVTAEIRPTFGVRFRF